MSGWLLVTAGSALAIAGMTVAVGAAALPRVDLYRWVAQSRPGAQAAGALLAAPSTIHRAAGGVVAGGVLLAALGLAPLVAPLTFLASVIVVGLGAVPIVLVITYALPRALGRRWPTVMVRRGVPWMRRLGIAATPFFPAPIEPPPRAALNALLKLGKADELLDTAEVTVLSGLLAFTERPVEEVMTPRTDIVAVREGGSLEEVGRRIAESGNSRIPVYRDSLDNITGMVYAFDLLKIAPGAELPLRPVMTVPLMKRCAALLFAMQRERQQFAVVLDEHGGTAGIVTFEDLLEELVGEIFDEYDRRAKVHRTVADLMEATGGTPVAEIAMRFEEDLPTKAETVGGLLAGIAGHIPQAGERYALAGLEFYILAATPNRVERVVIHRGPAPIIALTPRGES